ncbi:MAG: transporter [Candidatus Eisenbacteria bacterium]
MFSSPNFRSFRPAAALVAWLLLAVPPAAARELSTDRPDQTESPYTVERGRLQAEFQIASVGHGAGSGHASWQCAGLNLKRGMARSVDLQLVTSGLESIPLSNGRATGVGDLTLRLKWNARGNDSEGLAFGLMPYVAFPTGSEGLTAGGFEGGLIVPVAFPLSATIGIGVMAEADIVRNADGSGTHAEALFTATASRDLYAPLGGFVELAARFRPEAEGEREVMLDVGTTYGLGADLQFDAGVQWGLSAGAEDSLVFLGFTVRR